MADDVCNYIHTCDRCTRFKPPQERTEMQPILVSYLLELIHLHFLILGGKADDNRSVNILVVTDHFTPRKLCKLAQVKKQCTSTYGPETNGQCELFNTTLINMLGTLPTHAKKNWQEWIAMLTHAFNCTISSVTGFSPYFLMFGCTPKIPLGC